MEQWKKQLRKIPRKDRERLMIALTQLFVRDFSTLDRLRLKGYEHVFRVRVGNYRIIYYDDGEEITLKALSRRDETTYSDF